MNLETARLIILPFNPKHISDFLEFHNQKETMKFIGNGKSDWDEKELLEKIEKFSFKLPFGIYSINLKSENKIIGEFSIFQFENSSKSFEIGYIFNSNYWNKGFATELLQNIIPFLKKEYNLDKIVARINQKNSISQQLCLRLNMILTATDIINNKTRLTYEM